MNEDKIPFELSDYPDSDSINAEKGDVTPVAEVPEEDLSGYPDAEPKYAGKEAEQQEEMEQHGRALKSRLTAGRRIFLLILVALLIVGFIALYSISGFVSQAFARGLGWGWTGVALLTTAAFLLLTLLWREINGYLRLRSFEKLRTEASLWIDNPANAHVEKRVKKEFGTLLSHLEKAGDAEIQEPLVQIRREMELSDDMQEWIKSTEEVLLKGLDERAGVCIRRESLYVAVGTMVSPYTFLDAAILLWRAVKLVSKVSEVYHIRAGMCGTARIVYRSLVATAVAMITQEVRAALSIEFGRRIPFIGNFFPHFSQGFLNALMIIWVGREARRRCRPLPVPEEEEKRMLHEVLECVRNELKAREDEIKNGRQNSNEGGN